MPIGLMNGQFPIQQAPFDLTGALLKAMQARQLGSTAALNEAKQPYAGQQALAELINQQNINKYYGPNIESEIGLRGAQSGNLNEEATTSRYKREHGLLEPDMVQLMKYLGNMPGGQNASNPMDLAGGQSNTLTDSISNAITPSLMQQNAPTSPLQKAVMSAMQPGMDALKTNISNMTQQQQQPMQQNMPQQQQQQNSDDPLAGYNLNPLQKAFLKQKLGLTGNEMYKEKSTQAFNWVHSTPEVKQYEVAQLAGAGIDPSEAVNQLSSGATVPEILRKNGFDPSNAPEPDFLPTRGNITQLKQRQAALKEVDTLTDYVSKSLGPYSQTIAGYSPLQIKDAMTGMNEEKQVDFLAARMIAPELANARLMLANGKTGITAVNQIMGKSLSDAKVLQGFVTPTIFQKAQEKATNKLTEAFGKATKSYQVGKNKNASPVNTADYSVPMYDKSGNKVLVHSEDVEEALKPENGYRRR